MLVLFLLNNTRTVAPLA